MKRNAGLCGLMLVAAMAMSHPVMAAEGDVSVGGQILFTIKSPTAGESIADRVDAVTVRLRPILQNPYLRPSDIHLMPGQDDSVLLMVGNRLLVTVTPDDGRVNGLSAWDEARIWRNELRRTLPQVNVKPPNHFFSNH